MRVPIPSGDAWKFLFHGQLLLVANFIPMANVNLDLRNVQFEDRDFSGPVTIWQDRKQSGRSEMASG